MSEKISVLIPAFNREKYIETAIQSILDQTYRNLRIIVYDDGSTDKTVPIVEGLLLRDSRISLMKGHVNRGVAFARNELLKCAGKFACWQDSDDISDRNRIQAQHDELIHGGIDKIIFAGWRWFRWKRKGVWMADQKIVVDQAFATLLFPVDKTIRFKQCMKIGGEDWDWIKRMKEKYHEASIPKVSYYIRAHDDRIGVWKRKFKAKLSEDLISKLSYKDLIEYYKKNHE